MHDGVVARDVYATAIDYIKAKKPQFEKYFVKTIGFGVCWFKQNTISLTS